MITSFSWPWNPSTVLNATCSHKSGPNRVLNMLRSSRTWVLYIVMKPTRGANDGPAR